MGEQRLGLIVLPLSAVLDVFRLGQVVGIPDGCKVLSAAVDPARHAVVFVAEHPSFPRSLPGEQLPVVGEVGVGLPDDSELIAAQREQLRVMEDVLKGMR